MGAEQHLRLLFKQSKASFYTFINGFDVKRMVVPRCDAAECEVRTANYIRRIFARFPTLVTVRPINLHSSFFQLNDRRPCGGYRIVGIEGEGDDIAYSLSMHPLYCLFDEWMPVPHAYINTICSVFHRQII